MEGARPGKTAAGAAGQGGGTGRLPHLDFLRGAAALMVLAGHLRAFLFENHVPGGGAVTAAFYLATGLAHQAVIVFFAMSGYLVGGKALAQIFARAFCWRSYLSRRLSRLWLVVVPALALTLLFDLAGMGLTGGAGYDGSLRTIYGSGPAAPGIDSAPRTLLANLLFLQTVTSPVFGSNGPMWSLANEFWYYLFVPMVFWTAVAARSIAARLSGGVALGLMILLLPSHFVPGGVIWLAGAGAALAAGSARWDGVLTGTGIRLAAVTAFPAGVVLARLFPAAGDLWLGLLTAAALPVLARLPAPAGLYERLSRGLSELSFTLYLTHLPFLMLIVMTCFAPQRQGFGAAGMLVFAALFAAALLWAWLIWWLFERRTEELHRWLTRRRRAPASGITRAGAD